MEAATTETRPLDRVLERLESGLQVDLIATYELNDCTTDALVEAVLEHPDNAPFDHFPVRNTAGDIVGVLERSHQYEPGSIAGDVMRALDAASLAAASTGILVYMNLARDATYHLVVKNHGVEGLVTPSDLLKLPARVVLFTLITHLESTMAEAIRQHCSGDTWLQYLSEARRDKIQTEHTRLQERRSDPELLLMTQFADKRDIIAKGILDTSVRRGFEDEMKAVERLRNRVMHANDYSTGYLAERVNSTQHWILYLGAIS